jgi:UDP-N-acetylmuramoyl-L-alanyl-D-glutamate--2,6-diaminopimelate ligase
MNDARAATIAPRALRELLPELAGTAPGAVCVSGISLDSRTVQGGEAFLALRGEQHDGAAFAGEALRRGARIVLFEQGQGAGAGLEGSERSVGVSSLAARAGDIAARFYGDPSASLRVIGVTGTNGKTTCTQLIAQAFELLGRPCGVIGTLGWGFPGRIDETAHTTPDAVSVQRMLAELRRRGAGAVAMEVSSHALKQSRVDAVHFETAIFTNLTHDHLDYHGSFEDYGAAKQKLFTFTGLRHAVVNADDPFGRRILASLPAGVEALGFGTAEAPAPLRARNAAFSQDGLTAQVETPWGNGSLRTPLLGRFNLANALAVLGVLCLHGVGLDEALAVFPRLRPVAGRMERIAGARGPLVIVDYAHTPDALEQTLRALRQHCSGRLWCVFGCGGDRDRMKRPLMGRIAWEHADELVITSDNPRSETPSAIIAEIATGIPEHGAVCEPDRAAAIRRAIAAARPGDCVLVAGKGHEDYQEIGGLRTPFSDAAVAREALAAWGDAR